MVVCVNAKRQVHSCEMECRAPAARIIITSSTSQIYRQPRLLRFNIFCTHANYAVVHERLMNDNKFRNNHKDAAAGHKWQRVSLPMGVMCREREEVLFGQVFPRILHPINFILIFSPKGFTYGGSQYWTPTLQQSTSISIIYATDPCCQVSAECLIW